MSSSHRPGGATWTTSSRRPGRSGQRCPTASRPTSSTPCRPRAPAFGPWSRTPAAQRAALLEAIAAGIEARAAEFALAESRDTGKPLRLARQMDIPRAVQNFRFFAGAIRHERSDLHVTDDTAVNLTLRAPRGVAGLITPWNLPLYLLSWKVAPALATGNTVVAKPSELTPVTAHMLAQVCREAGLPPGVLNIVHGTGPQAGAALVAHPAVPTLSFTGGTATGRAIAAAAAPRFKRVALELGGKNPTIVFADAPAEALEQAVRAAFTNQGQLCLCGSRVFVERSAYADFLERFVAAARAIRLGDPLDDDTQCGALVSAAQFAKTRFYVDLARREGGRILCGGDAPPAPVSPRCRDGYFYLPTVITGLDAGCRTNREEIFGPVVTVQPFDDEAQLVAQANAVDYGLSASLWTRDLDRALRVARALECGTVWVNCWLLRDLRVPFGGCKHSGLGREGGEEALRFFTEPKTVCIRIRPAPGAH